MLEAQVEQEFDASAETVWALTGPFGGLKAWLPGVVDCRVEGSGAWDQGGNAVRLVELMDGSVTKESLLSLDERQYRYRYGILEAKGFDRNSEYQAEFVVVPLGVDRCKVCWGARFTLPASIPAEKAQKAQQRVQQMYQFFLNHLVGLIKSNER
ncbi:MAG TPA: SRPBCC family protein [Pseudomonadales bacterium]|nr:SRPBCC family protein [Pseudomonadales bacterium]